MNILSTARRFGKKHLAQSSDFVETKSKSEALPTMSRAATTGLGLGVLGAVVGAGVGSFMGRQGAIDSFENSIEATQIELSWQEPVLESTILGQIPQDEDIRPGLLNHLGFNSKPSRINPHTENVVRTNAVLDGDGQPVMQTQTQVFEGYGTPSVDWATHRVLNHELTGYDRDVTSRYGDQWGCHKNWFPPEDEPLKEWCIDYDPKISRKQVGSYSSPKVNFDRPDDVNQEISSAAWSGAIKGAGIGFVTGLAVGVLGSVLTRPANEGL